MSNVKAIADLMLSNEEIGNFYRKVDEIRRQLDGKDLQYAQVMAELQHIIEGHQTANAMINFDISPTHASQLHGSIEPGDQISSRLRGKWMFHPKHVQLYLSKKQIQGRLINGDSLRDHLEGQIVVGEHLLDFYLTNTQFIPDSWKGTKICFWGTLYCHVDNGLSVRSLYWYNNTWESKFNRLGQNFDSSYPALVAIQT